MDRTNKTVLPVLQVLGNQFELDLRWLALLKSCPEFVAQSYGMVRKSCLSV